MQTPEKRHKPNNTWHTVRIGEKLMLILQYNHIRPVHHYSNPSIKLRQENGTLWEACSSLERCEALYDSMDKLDDIEINEIIKGKDMTPETFKEKYGPHTVCSFRLEGNERPIHAAMSELLSADAYSQIVDGTCVPEVIATEKKGDDEMTVDLFVKYKHARRDDYDYDMTFNTSIRLTLLRVPDYQ